MTSEYEDDGSCRDIAVGQASDVAIVPFPALGDITIYLRLAWIFHASGKQVTFFSNAFCSAREYFPWLQIVPEVDDDLEALASQYALVIACFEKYYHKREWRSEYAELANVAFVTAKKISRDSGLDGRGVHMSGREFAGASRAFCLNSKKPWTMVDWVDSYAREVFGLTAGAMPDAPVVLASESRRVLIFPTTPQSKKNYWLGGFCWLADRLRKRGWQVEFICMPDEVENISAGVNGYPVKSFPNIRALMDHIATAAVVISNDSGGGHLASLLNLRTFTITRRHANFAWRPGFNQKNTVIHPLFRFKSVRGRYIWRPFVPVWRIPRKLGHPHA